MRKIHKTSELRHLQQVLGELAPITPALTVSAFDGFVAALILCPDVVMPGEWLPEVFGQEDEDDTIFDDMPHVQRVMGAVMQHYNRVAGALSTPGVEYECVFTKEEDESVPEWGEWIDGFTLAMQLRPDSWDDYGLCAEKGVRLGFFTLLALRDVLDGTSRLAEDAQAQLAALATDMIPDSVSRMNDWRKASYGRSDPLDDAYDAYDLGDEGEPASEYPPLRLVPSPKVGRNEPCTCGSGRKYKKCCGAH